MKIVSSIVWGFLAVLFAFAFAMVTGIFNPQEHAYNALWLVVAAGCFFTLAYRFYGAFLAAKVLSLDDRRITPAFRLNERKKFLSYQQMGSLWTSFCGYRWRWPSYRTGASPLSWLSSRIPLDSYWRGRGRRGP